MEAWYGGENTPKVIKNYILFTSEHALLTSGIGPSHKPALM